MKREIIGQGTVVVLIVAIVAAIVGGAIGYVLKPAAEVPPDVAELQATINAQAATISDLEAQLADVIPQQFEGMKVVWIGGGAGDAPDTLFMNGALEAGKYLGVDVDYVHTAWEPERMVQEFATAIALKPDGIVVMGHPGYEGLVGLFQDATDEGIRIMLADTDVPQLRLDFPTVGFVGPDMYVNGQVMGRAGLEIGNLHAGDRAAVISGSWDEPERALSAQGTYDVLVEAGLIVDKVEHPSAVYADPSVGIPYIVGYYSAHPDVKLMVFDGGATTAATQMYMEELGVEPGEITVVGGFGVSLGGFDSMREGYLQASTDVQQYLTGYLSVVNVCMGKAYNFSGLKTINTSFLITPQNMSIYEDPAYEGYRWV